MLFKRSGVGETSFTPHPHGMMALEFVLSSKLRTPILIKERQGSVCWRDDTMIHVKLLFP